MKGAKVDGARTKAGRRLLGRYEIHRGRGTVASLAVNLGEIRAIEAEARSAALAEVEEAVKGGPFEGDYIAERRRVLAAIARLQEKSA